MRLWIIGIWFLVALILVAAIAANNEDPDDYLPKVLLWPVVPFYLFAWRVGRTLGGIRDD